MRPWILVPVLSSIQCTPLEERVKMFDAGWCADPRSTTAACIVDGDTFDLLGCERTLDEDGDDDGDGIPDVLGIVGPKATAPPGGHWP
mgnify:CR=1 FL=1